MGSQLHVAGSYWLSTGTAKLKREPPKLSIELCVLNAAGWGPTGETPMDDRVKDGIWDLAAGTVIAVSLVSGMAFIVIASAIH